MKRKFYLVLAFAMILFLLGFISTIFIDFQELMGNEKETYISQDEETSGEIVVESEGETIEEPIEEAKISNIKILAVGDIMFHSPQYNAAFNKEINEYDFTSVFKYVKKYIESVDLAIGNLETVIAGEEVGYSGYPRFNTPEAALFAIKEAGFDILSTANNHSLDQGKAGLINTIDNIHKYGMKNIGTYKEENTILVEEINEIKIGFLSYTYGLNGMDYTLTEEELDYMVNLIDEDKIKSHIEDAKDMELDLIVVFIHWGNEYQREPSPYQMELGEKIIEWGADIILGSHPHVVQKSQIINKDGKDKFIIYSMGNFLSNQRKETIGNPYTEDGIMVQLEIEKDLADNNTIIKNIHYIPTWVHRYRDNGRLVYEILPIADYINGDIQLGDEDNLRERLEKSFHDTMKVMIENSSISEFN
ncbi:MAG: CapA family protein [Tissierellia bacterium]|nr:CapA family protein [Tissierellia bacterium]